MNLNELILTSLLSLLIIMYHQHLTLL